MEQQAGESSPVSPQEVGDAAVTFMSGLADAIGAAATADVTVDDTDIEVKLTGDELGLLVGPGGPAARFPAGKPVSGLAHQGFPDVTPFMQPDEEPGQAVRRPQDI